MILLSVAVISFDSPVTTQSILTTIHHGLSLLYGTLPTATGQIVAGQINFVAAPTISSTPTPTPPKPYVFYHPNLYPIPAESGRYL